METSRNPLHCKVASDLEGNNCTILLSTILNNIIDAIISGSCKSTSEVQSLSIEIPVCWEIRTVPVALYTNWHMLCRTDILITAFLDDIVYNISSTNCPLASEVLTLCMEVPVGTIVREASSTCVRCVVCSTDIRAGTVSNDVINNECGRSCPGTTPVKFQST